MERGLFAFHFTPLSGAECVKLIFFHLKENMNVNIFMWFWN